MKIALVTDSTADIPEALLEQHQIHVVPNLVILNGEELEDGKGISREEFYQRMITMQALPTTATASVGAYQTLYASLLERGADLILSIHASSLLSGIYNAAQTAAQAFGERVKVLDSEQVSLGLGFQVLAAAEAIARSVPIGKLLEYLSELRQRIHLFAMLDTLEYIRRSGRVSWARARLGTLLQIKPIVELKEGKVLSRGEVRTRQKGIQRLIEIIKGLGALERLAILHTNAEGDARYILEELNPQLPFSPLIVNVTTIIGTHVGPNGLGFVAITR